MNYTDALFSIKRSLNYEKSTEALWDILNQFKLSPDLKQERTTEDWEKYNDNYAGAYFDEDGYLVVCTVNLDLLYTGRYSEQVIHKKCKYSYKYLHILQRLIVPFMHKYGICCIGIDIKENSVKVEIKDDEQANSHIEELIGLLKSKEVYNDEVIKIQKTKNILVLA